MLNRRRFLLDAALAAAAGRCTKLPDAAGLKDLRSYGSPVVGGQTTWVELEANAEFASRFLHEFRMVTPGRELKWQTISPTTGEYRFEYADKIIDWATAHRLLVRGHNLIWPDYGTPEWVKQAATPSNARDLIEHHIHTVVGRYRGRIHSWDVLNEALDVWDRRADMLAAHPWVDLLGPSYIDIAFHAAADTDPKARLIWNENYLASDESGDEANREAMLAQLRRLRRSGVPIHGIGIESHLFADKPLAVTGMERFVGEVRSLGLEIQITELDVIDTSLPSDLRARDAAVADWYKRYLEMMLRIAEPTVVVFWTPTDRGNWLDWAAKSSPKYRRQDGLLHRPGLLDSNLKDKPAYYAVREVLSR